MPSPTPPALLCPFCGAPALYDPDAIENAEPQGVVTEDEPSWADVVKFVRCQDRKTHRFYLPEDLLP